MEKQPGQEVVSDGNEAPSSQSPIASTTSSVKTAARKVMRRRVKHRSLKQKDITPEIKRPKRRKRRGKTFTEADIAPSAEQMEEVTSSVESWILAEPIDLQIIQSPASLRNAYLQTHASDQRVIEAFPLHFNQLFAVAFNTARQQASALEQKVSSWLQSTEIDPEKTTSPEQLYALFSSQHPADAKRLEKQKPTLMKLFIEAFRKAQEEPKKLGKENVKNVKELDGRIQSWLREPIDLQKVKSADELKKRYRETHPEDSKLMDVHKEHIDALFAKAYKDAEQKEGKEVNDLEKRISAWVEKQEIDPTTVRSADALKKLYLEKHPQDKARCTVQADLLNPLFTAAYRKGLEAYEAKKKRAKADIASATNSLLVTEDFANESFESEKLFISTMLSRLEGILAQHKKPNTLYKELETYATILVEKLHAVWQKKHEAVRNKTLQQELKQIENAIAGWKPPKNSQFATFHQFRIAFLEACNCKEVANKHESFTNSLLKLQWAQYSNTKAGPEAESLEQAGSQSVAAVATTSDLVQLQAQGLSPVIAAALSRTETVTGSYLDEITRNRFSVDWNALSPALTSFLLEGRLRIGGDRLRRLVQSQKVETLFAGREDNLAPFFLVMCGELQNEGEIPRCLQELELSENPKQTIRIMLASDECRRAAFKVRQSPVIWNRFISALSTIGLSLKDLHLDVEDEDRAEQEIDEEMMQDADANAGIQERTEIPVEGKAPSLESAEDIGVVD